MDEFYNPRDEPFALPNWGSRARFAAEQTGGESETKFKSVIIERFKHDPHILRAYLALVLYSSDTPPSVALCVALDSDAYLKEVVDVAADEFRKMFKRSQWLDILSVDEEQEQRLAAVCEPFYVRARG